MMKKLAKLTALLAVAELLFGAVGCSDDDDDDIAVTGVTLNKEKLDIEVDGTEKLMATVTPADATNNGVKWSSDHDEIATVDKDGIVTGVAAGNAKITVTTEDGNKTAVCEVTVTNGNTGGDNPGNTGGDNPGTPTAPTLTGIKITVDENKVKTTYTVGEDFDRTGITVTATYSDGSAKDVTTAIEFKVTCNGEVFTTATAGNFEVTLTATYGDKTVSVICPIEVKASGITGSNDPVEISFGDMVVGTYEVAYDATTHGKPTVTPSNSNFVLDVTIAHTTTDKWNIKASSGTADGKYKYTRAFSTQGASRTTRRSVLLTLDTVYAKSGSSSDANRKVAYYQCADDNPSFTSDFKNSPAFVVSPATSTSSFDPVEFSVNGADGKYVYIGCDAAIDIAYIVVSLKS